MLKGNIFSRAARYTGIAGSTLISVYLILVTFVPGTEKSAMIIAMPGGVLSLAWIIMYTGKLFKLGRTEKITVKENI